MNDDYIEDTREPMGDHLEREVEWECQSENGCDNVIQLLAPIRYDRGEPVFLDEETQNMFCPNCGKIMFANCRSEG